MSISKIKGIKLDLSFTNEKTKYYYFTKPAYHLEVDIKHFNLGSQDNR